MWLVIRWILLPLAVGRRIHPSIDEFKRFKRIGSKKFSKAARAGASRAGGTRDAFEDLSTDRWIRQLKDGFDSQLPMGEESIE